MSKIDLTETVARAMWTAREQHFPDFTRMTWERGTNLARDAALRDAATVIMMLLDEGLRIVPIVPTAAMVRNGAQEFAMTAQRPMIAETNAKAIYRAMINAADSGEG